MCTLGCGRVAWLAAAVDTRVVGVAPAVIETLDIVPNLNFEYQVSQRATGGHGDAMLHGWRR